LAVERNPIETYDRWAMPSQWLALTAGVDSRTHARQLRQSWERLLAGRELKSESGLEAAGGLRQPIVESWKRSLATGLDPTDLLAPIEADESEVIARWFDHPLSSLTHVLTEQLRKVADESRSIVVVTDASGLVLHRVGDEWLKERAAEMNLVEGARYSEAADGTNGIGTALAADHAFQVFAFEHFNERHHEWVCSGAPVHDPVSGRIVGLVDLSGLWRMANPRSLELVAAATARLERGLVEARRDQDARLRRRYGDLMRREADLLVNRDGYVLAGSERHSKPLEVPEGGGEVGLDDGSVAVAEPLGHGEAYLVRSTGPRGFGARSNAESRQPRRDSEERMSAYLAAALDCVIMADASGRVVEFNPAAERTFGYSRAEALGRTMAELIVPPSLRERHSTAFARFVETGQGTMLGRRLELTGMRADGSEFPVELALSQVEAEPVLICGALRDISAAKQSERHLRELADEQAALRRVATAVGHESSPQQLFAIVAEQVARIIDVPLVRLVRYESDGSAVELIGGWGESLDPLAVGTRWQLDGPVVLARVWQSGRPARLDDYTQLPGEAAAVVRQAGMRSAVASPITVDGRLWGAIAVLSPRREPLPESTEARLADFTELVATAIANAESRAGLRRLAGEQAALGRVATLVAKGATGDVLFAAVAREVAGLFGVEMVSIDRYENGESIVLASLGVPEFPVGSRWPLDGPGVRALVYGTGRPARVDDFSEVAGTAPAIARAHGIQSAVGVPIVVDGKVWGILGIGSRQGELLPGNVEQHLAAFTELVSTAIANSDARDQVSRLLDEQSALRRVATLVAEGASAGELFSSVAEEVAGVVGLPFVGVHRYEPDATFTMVARARSAGDTSFTVGSRWPVEDEGLAGVILASGRPARKDDYSTMQGPVGAAVRHDRMASMVGVPIVVDGSIWGFMVAGGGPGEAIPAGTEQRLARFTELVATAVSNATIRAELAASRARVIAAADQARRRIERDLHDGAQQQLVTLVLGLRSAEGRVPAGLEDMRAEVGRFADRLTSVVEELREMSRGIHPAILTEGGLSPAIEALALRSSVPVKLNVRCERRLPDGIEVAAYYVVSEALTNAAKHADASRVEIALHVEDGTLCLSVVDDGAGGAAPSGGSGLIGLKDRVEALGGTFDVASPPGRGTRLDVEMPLLADRLAAPHSE
jgi:PAS domain S-box-containing protein